MTELAVQVPRVAPQPACAAVAAGRRATLLDLLDRVLGKGVVAYGDIVLSIADLDLVYLNLRAVLSSIGTLERDRDSSFVIRGSENNSQAANGAPEPAEEGERRQTHKFLPDPTPPDMPVVGERPASPENSKAEASGLTSSSRSHDSEITSGAASSSRSHKAGKLELDPQKTAQGLAKLAMTLIHLLRKLMERQAIRRMEAGTLTPEQLERAGQAFQQLDHQIKELCNQFGLKEEDLNLDLGPLGKVV